MKPRPIVMPAVVAGTVMWLGLAMLPATASEPLVATPNGGMLRAPVTSYYALRFENVVRQQLDLSCGAAALATLMKYHYGLETSEKQLIEDMLEGVSKDQQMKIAKAGFSMLELKHQGERKGFTVGGFRISDVNKLAQLRVPAITLIKVRGYNHFVVIKGVRNGIVHLADPAFGNRAKPVDRFAETWNQIILVFVNPNLDTANSAFTLEGADVAPTREIVSLTDRTLRSVARGAAEF